MVRIISNFLIFLAFVFILPTAVLAQNTNAEVLVDSSQYPLVEVGSEFEVNVKLNTTEPIVSAKVHLSFDPTLMEPLTIDREKSGLSNWVENAYFVENGKAIAKLQASTPNPGLSGEINVATLKFKKLKAGDGSFKVDSSSFVLNSENKNLLSTGGIFNFMPFSLLFFVAILVIVILFIVLVFRKLRGVV